MEEASAGGLRNITFNVSLGNPVDAATSVRVSTLDDSALVADSLPL